MERSSPNGVPFQFGQIEQLLSLPDGKLLGLGRTEVGFSGKPLLARYADGRLDPTFSDDGHTTFELGVDPSVVAAEAQPDGRIVIAGFASYAEDTDAGDGTIRHSRGTDAFAARFLLDGRLDPSFSADGVLVHRGPQHGSEQEFSETTARFTGMALDSGGRVLLEGEQTEKGQEDAVEKRWFALRLTPGGTRPTQASATVALRSRPRSRSRSPGASRPRPTGAC